MARATVRGDKEIIANIRRAQRSIGGGFLDRTLHDSLEPMKERTEANALRLRQPGNPRGGHLDQGVVIAKHKQRGSAHREFWVSFRNRARKLAHLVEFGTAPHWQPRRGRMHPGARAKPFFRPAFEAEKEGVAAHIGRRVWEQIARSLKGAR